MRRKPSESTVLDAYEQGKRHGRQEAEDAFARRVELLQRTHRQLLKEILRLDLVEPVAGIALSFSHAQKIARILRRHSRTSPVARDLDKRIAAARAVLVRSLQDIVQEI